MNKIRSKMKCKKKESVQEKIVTNEKFPKYFRKRKQ